MRLIDADDMKKHIKGTDYKRIISIMEWIDNQPTIEPQRMRGKWKQADKNEPYIVQCSECRYLTDNGSNFCPNCGADMRGETANDD